MLARTIHSSASQSDDDLLHRWTIGGDRAAMDELIERYAGMVYAAAWRQTRDADLAEDVSQSVFVTFSRRSKSIRSGATLGAWLLQTTRYTAANAMKSQARRRRHEKSAAISRVASQSPSQSNWQEIEPVLDEALGRLPKTDQAAVVLRYFRGLSFAEVAAAIGTTEDAARKRIQRALYRLKEYLIAAGAPAAAMPADLSSLLANHAAGNASSHLIAQVKAAVVAGHLASGSTVYGATSLIGATKVAASAAIACVLVAGGVTVIRVAGLNVVATAQPSPTTAPAVSEDNPFTAFDSVYALKPNEKFKWITAPPESLRRAWIMASFPNNDYVEPDNMILEQKPNGKFDVKTYLNSGSTGFFGSLKSGRSVKTLALALCDVRPWEMQGDKPLSFQITGDGVFRQGLAAAELLENLRDVASVQSGHSVILTRDTIEHEMIVATPGRAAVDGRTISVHLQIPIEPRNDALGQLFPSLDGRTVGHANRKGPIDSLLDQLSDRTDYWFMSDLPAANAPPTTFEYTIDAVPYDGDTAGQHLRNLIDALNRQTGLVFKSERRAVQVWTWRYSN